MEPDSIKIVLICPYCGDKHIRWLNANQSVQHGSILCDDVDDHAGCNGLFAWEVKFTPKIELYRTVKHGD